MTSKTFEQILLTRRQFSKGLMTFMGLASNGCQIRVVVNGSVDDES